MHDTATRLAHYLTDATGSPTGRVKVRLPAADQRALFGRYFGKGAIYIDGANETVEHWVKRGFGHDSECTAYAGWRDL
jgi:hypothetical protein